MPDELEGNQRRIIDALRLHRSDGMTPPELANELQLSVQVVNAELKKLRARDFAQKDPDRSQRGGHQTWMVNEFGLQKLDQRFREKKRKCLGGCGQMFKSLHAGNRICPKCSGQELLEGVEEMVA